MILLNLILFMKVPIRKLTIGLLGVEVTGGCAELLWHSVSFSLLFGQRGILFALWDRMLPYPVSRHRESSEQAAQDISKSATTLGAASNYN